MKRFLTTLFFAAIALVSCEYAVEIRPSQFDVDAPDFYAEITDETRTQLSDSNRVLWCSDDLITIFLRDDHNLKYKIKTISDSRTNATFSFTRQGVTNTGAKFLVYYGVYPYSEYNKAYNNTLSLNLPSVQPYVVGSELKNVPMVAVSTDLNLSFQAPTSLLRLNVSRDDMGGNPYILKQILVSSESTYISGMVNVDMSETPCKAVVDESSELKSRHISIDLGDGVELSTDGQSVYAALADVTLPADDLSLTFTVDVDGKSYDVKKKIKADIHYQAGRVFTAPVQISADDFTPSNGNSNGGDITESDDFILNDDGSYSCPITEDMIIDEPLYLPNGTTATISLGENATLSNSTYNVNSALVVIDEGADLTIDGSGAITSITATALASTLNATRAAEDNTAFPIVVNGTLRIKGGDFTLNSFATSWLNCGIYIGPNGKLIVEGGTFRSPKGSFIFGHELGNRPTIEIVGGRFEGYDPSDNDFDGEGSNYLEPEYASYYVAENELVVAERTAEWEVDNNYLLKSIIENGGTAHLVVPEEGYYELTESMSVNYPVTLDISNSADAQCRLYFDTPINCYADVNIKGDSYDPNMLYIDSIEAIANVYSGATLTLGKAMYFGGTDEVSETLFNLYGGKIVVNDGSYVLSERINADNMFVVDPRYAEESSLVVNGGVFYGFDPERVTFDEEVKNCVVDGKGAVISFDGGHHTIEDRVGTFTAATYNVDGLPEKVLGFITLNGDGPGSAGTTTISEKVNATGWDFVAFQENFSYNTELQSKMTNYTFGKHRNFSVLSALGTADTDGQNFATRNESCKFTSETMVEFVAKEGGLTDGANTSIKKGIRHYVVEFTSGLVIDVLTTHMNTADNDAQIAAQNKQLTEVANYINSICSNNRPIIFMGDMNTRYTRNDYEMYFWSVLDSDLRCDDPWVEYQWNNYYPVFGSDSIMTGEYGMQKGEVVDKIICINNRNASVRISADTYLHDEAFGDVADHKPVVAKFSFYNM